MGLEKWFVKWQSLVLRVDFGLGLGLGFWFWERINLWFGKGLGFRFGFRSLGVLHLER